MTWFDVTGNPAALQLWSRRYTHGGTFAAAKSIIQATSLDYQVAPSVTLDDSGVATSAFGVLIGSSYEVFTSQSKPTDTAWPTPTQMETDDIAAKNDPNSGFGAETMPIVQHDPAGNVTLIWRKRMTGTRFDLSDPTAPRRRHLGSAGAARDGHNQQRLLPGARGRHRRDRRGCLVLRQSDRLGERLPLGVRSGGGVRPWRTPS